LRKGKKMNKRLARQAAAFVYQRKPNEWLVQGRQGRKYHVKRHSLSYSCYLRQAGKLLRPCHGNSFSICYHVGAAIIASAKEKGNAVAFCENLSAAERLSRLGGKIFEVKSAQSGKRIFLVVQAIRRKKWRGKKKSKAKL